MREILTQASFVIAGGLLLMAMTSCYKSRPLLPEVPMGEKPIAPADQVPNSPNQRSPAQERGENVDQEEQENDIRKTFYIKNAKLYDKDGYPFIPRGVNNPHAYYKNQSLSALATIKSYGFNTIRMVWCTDNLINPGRCDPKDMHPPADLRTALAEAKRQRLVAMLTLQNATGSDSSADLRDIIDWLTRPDVKTILNQYQDIVLINIANEWYGTWDKSTAYVNSYKQAIRSLRTAGLEHVLIIDSRGYGQDPSSIVETSASLLQADPNIMISSHMYDVYDTVSEVSAIFEYAYDNKIPFLIGEFACNHYSFQPLVQCDAIMNLAELYDFGYIGWSWTGNSSDLESLDVVSNLDWSTPSSWGTKLIYGTYGIASTSKEACFFSPDKCY